MMAHLQRSPRRLLGCEGISGLSLLHSAAGKKLGMLSASLSRTVGSDEGEDDDDDVEEVTEISDSEDIPERWPVEIEDGLEVELMCSSVRAHSSNSQRRERLPFSLVVRNHGHHQLCGSEIQEEVLSVLDGYLSVDTVIEGRLSITDRTSSWTSKLREQHKETAKQILSRDQASLIPQESKSHKKVDLTEENNPYSLNIPKNFICEHCYGAFRSSYHLKRHLYIHTGERPYECDMCDMKFIQKYHLDRHKRVHSGEKPYQCERCQQAFSRTDRLLKHKRMCQGCHTKIAESESGTSFPSYTPSFRIHRDVFVNSGERPFECDMCDMKFVQKYHLDRHKRVHSGEKPYQCERCQQAFSRTDRLLKHKRICQGCHTKPLAL